MEFKQLAKLKKGDNVAILSPSFAAPAVWPQVYELGIKRLTEKFGLVPVEYPATKKLDATKEERAKDLIDAFSDDNIKAVIATIGGNDQVTYIKNLPAEPFVNNPKPFFGFSDNTHFVNFLWQNGIPSYYGGSIFTQYAMQQKMDEMTVEYLDRALFNKGWYELKSSEYYVDVGLDWNDPATLNLSRKREDNIGWIWDGEKNAEGITWGGCLESIDEMLRHGINIPALEQFGNIVLFTETSEEMPSPEYVFKVYRALGERGILGKVRGVLVGRPKSWYFSEQKTAEEMKSYQEEQREAILRVVRMYNKDIPVILNLDFGHTDPQIPLPCGKSVKIDSVSKKIFIEF